MGSSFWCALLAWAAACNGARVAATDDPAGVVADAGRSDAAVPQPRDAAASDYADATLATDAALDKLTIHPRHGAATDDRTLPAGPGLALDSGAPMGELFAWLQSTPYPAQPGHGDLVVLTATGDDAAASLLGSFGSAQTLSLADVPSPADDAAAAAVLARAEAVWFVGGDQAKYVRWAGSALLLAVQGVYDRGGVVGGSSAGMIILGSAVNDALLTTSESLTTARLLANPFDPDLHFTRDLFRFAPLAGSITDPHFSTQDRMGRLVTFMARQVEGAAGYRGLAVDDGVALVIAGGVGRRLGTGAGSVYVVQGGAPERLVAGQSLRYAELHVRRLASAQHGFDFARGCGTTLAYELTVDGATSTPYSTHPYASGTPASDCPTP